MNTTSLTPRQQKLQTILYLFPGTDSATQRHRIMTALETLGGLTTFEGSRFLDCYDPRARIKELRRAGRRIQTHIRAEQTESGVFHRVGLYTLEPGK